MATDGSQLVVVLASAAELVPRSGPGPTLYRTELAVSTDAGRSWAVRTGPSPPDHQGVFHVLASDVAVGVDGAIHVVALVAPSLLLSDEESLAPFYARSDDLGRTWVNFHVWPEALVADSRDRAYVKALPDGGAIVSMATRDGSVSMARIALLDKAALRTTLDVQECQLPGKPHMMMGGHIGLVCTRFDETLNAGTGALWITTDASLTAYGLTTIHTETRPGYHRSATLGALIAVISETAMNGSLGFWVSQDDAISWADVPDLSASLSELRGGAAAYLFALAIDEAERIHLVVGSLPWTGNYNQNAKPAMDYFTSDADLDVIRKAVPLTTGQDSGQTAVRTLAPAGWTVSVGLSALHPTVLAWTDDGRLLVAHPALRD